MNFNVMTFNVWGADNQTNKIAEIIQAGNADIIGLQEMQNGGGQALAAQLGYHYYNQSTNDIQILSRFPIIGTSGDNRGALVEVTPGHNAWIFNCHFIPYPYQPYQLRDNPSLTEAQLINGAESTRGHQFDNFLNSIANATGGTDVPVFFVGDYNEPSHLDWTEEAAAATARTFDKKVMWPGSEKIADAGFIDSFRAARPDEVNDRGYTWTPGYPPPNVNGNEVQDRIDMIYYRGSQLSTLFSQTIGYDGANPNTDIAVAGFPSDHRAVFSGFNLSGLTHSTLTFSRLQHNPGSSVALNDGDYGDRLITSENIVATFSASAGAHWDTYDGDIDGTNNNWNVGVAQLQSQNGDGIFDLTLTPDDGFGVLLESFDLVDYADFAQGHTVEWELWSGAAGTGSLLLDGTEIIAADQINLVSTGMNDAIFGALTLRIMHLAGDGSDLAIDNIRFIQVAIPEPNAAVLAFAIAFLSIAGRRNKPNVA